MNPLTIPAAVTAKYVTDVILWVAKLLKWTPAPIVTHGLVVAVTVGVEFAAGLIYPGAIPITILGVGETVLAAIGYDQFSGVLTGASAVPSVPTVAPASVVVSK